MPLPPDGTAQTNNHSSMFSRRQFLRLSLSGLALTGAAALSASPFAQAVLASQVSQSRIGIQLYTVRTMMQQSVEQTLRMLAAVGYHELEFAGYFDNQPEDIKLLLDELGMTAPSAHVQLDSLVKNTSQYLDAAAILGHEYLVIPYLSEQQHENSISGYQRLAEQFNQLGEICRSSGIQLAYHNHAFEFDNIDGQLPYDVLLQECEADLLAMELDLYWTVKAGFDPVEYFTRFPGRFPLWHVKDMDTQGDFADVGKGVIDFANIFAHGALAGIQHKFVERDHTNDLKQTVEQGYRAMKVLTNAT